MADEAINISKTKLDLGMPPRLALAHARQLDTSNMECELAVDSSAFEGIMFSRTFGLQTSGEQAIYHIHHSGLELPCYVHVAHLGNLSVPLSFFAESEMDNHFPWYLCHR